MSEFTFAEKLIGFKKLLRMHLWSRGFFPFAFAVVIASPPATLVVLLKVLFAAFLLGLLWGGLYVVNDLSDFEQDRKALHAYKSKRPIATGLVSPQEGLLFALVVLSVVLSTAFSFDFNFFVVLVLLSLFQFAYTLRPVRLKERFLLDLTPQLVNPFLRFSAGFVLFKPFSEVLLGWPVIVAVTLGMLGSFLFEKSSAKRRLTELKLGYRNTAVLVEKSTLDAVGLMLLAWSGFAFVYSFVVSPLNLTFFVAALVASLPFVPLYLRFGNGLMRDIEKKHIAVMHLNLFTVAVALLVVWFFAL